MCDRFSVWSDCQMLWSRNRFCFRSFYFYIGLLRAGTHIEYISYGESCILKTNHQNDCIHATEIWFANWHHKWFHILHTDIRHHHHHRCRYCRHCWCLCCCWCRCWHSCHRAMRPFTFCTLNLSSCTRKSINTHCYSHIICSNDNYILVTITNEWDSYGTVCEYIAVYQVINISIWVHGMCVMTQMRWMRQVWEWASRLAFVWYMHTSVQRIAAISKNLA